MTEDGKKIGCKKSGGFLFGMILGGALVYLVGTKSGRKMLKRLSEKGTEFLDGFSDLEDIESLAEEEDAGGIYEEAQNPKVEKTTSETKSNHSHNGHALRRRFFRGTNKK